MSNIYWVSELWRITFVIFIALVIGIQTHSWLACLILSLMGYILWLLYKLRQLYNWLEDGAKPSYVPEGNGLWEGITQQIQSMQKKSETRRKRMRKLLKRSKIIISGLPYATLVLNDNNEIDWANKTSAEFLNIDGKRDRGQRIDNLIRTPEFHQLLTSSNSKEIEISSPHNTDLQLALQLTSVQKNFKLLIARDISERVNILQMRKNFIANASHELKTPLTVISGYLEIMQKDDHLPEHLLEDISIVSDQAGRMQSIIEDLLILSRLENSALTIDSTSIIDVPTIIQNICTDEIKRATNHQHTLEASIDFDLTITGEKTEITSVCSNLIHNAIRHTQNGTQVIVEWKQRKTGEACLVVKDNGQGISSEHIPRLTERFYRVDKGRARNEGGTGLGLAIVQHIIQRHGGRLDIQSTVGKGSVFTVCFPPKRVVS